MIIWLGALVGTYSEIDTLFVISIMEVFYLLRIQIMFNLSIKSIFLVMDNLIYCLFIRFIS